MSGWHERPPGWWQGDEWRWALRASAPGPSISVIEAEAEGFDEHHERKLREEGAKRVPFGFARALADDCEAR